METKFLFPLISCICITKNRTELLNMSINSFHQQSYPNKELIISYPKDDKNTARLIDNLLKITSINIQKLERSNEDSIGMARNNAIKNCNGEYICMWDDDDLYYPTRIEDQYNSINVTGEKFESSILLRILFYEATARKAFLSYQSYWACTLLCKKVHLIAYPCADRNEFEYIPVIEFLKSKYLIAQIELSPSLYTCVFHGNNIMKYTTFLFLINQSITLPEHISQNITNHIRSITKSTF